MIALSCLVLCLNFLLCLERAEIERKLQERGREETIRAGRRRDKDEDEKRLEEKRENFITEHANRPNVLDCQGVLGAGNEGEG